MDPNAPEFQGSLEHDFPEFELPPTVDLGSIYDAWAKYYNDASSKPVALAEIAKAHAGFENLHKTITQNWRTIWLQLSRLREREDLSPAAENLLAVVMEGNDPPPPDRKGYQLIAGPVRLWVDELNKIRGTLSPEQQIEATESAGVVRSFIVSTRGVEFCAWNWYMLRNLASRIVHSGCPDTVDFWSSLPKEEREQIAKKVGRQPDGEAHETIQRLAVELYQTGKRRFRHADGSPNLSAIAREVLDAHPEILFSHKWTRKLIKDAVGSK